MTKSLWEPGRLNELRYQKELTKLINKLLSARLPLGDPAALSARLAEISAAGAFDKWGEALARRMVTGLAVQQARTWRLAAAESMRGRQLYAALQNELGGPVGVRIAQLVRNNASLIRSVPLDLAAKTTAHVAAEQRAGRRSEDIAGDLRSWFPEMARSHVQLIARTEVSKASTALTEARAEELNLPAYIWRTSKDARVRPSHRQMDGVICFWDDPPAPEALAGIKSMLGHYNCGDAPNDRCYPEPMLRFDQVTWLHKVCRGDRIQMMTRAAFAKLAGVKVVEAAVGR